MDKEKMADGGRRYSYRVYRAVAAFRGLQLTEYVMEAIDASTKEAVLSEYLAWEGIIGYTDTIIAIVNA